MLQNRNSRIKNHNIYIFKKSVNGLNSKLEVTQMVSILKDIAMEMIQSDEQRGENTKQKNV